MVSVIEIVACKARDMHGINRVVLSGGSFQNRYLSYHAEDRLKRRGFEVFTHREVPCNDGGVALGQIMIAAKKRASGEWGGGRSQ
jgi:hydrogenase maturation protein HypF